MLKEIRMVYAKSILNVNKFLPIDFLFQILETPQIHICLHRSADKLIL